MKYIPNAYPGVYGPGKRKKIRYQTAILAIFLILERKLRFPFIRHWLNFTLSFVSLIVS